MKEYKTSKQILKEKKLYNNDEIKSDEVEAVNFAASLSNLLEEASAIVEQKTFFEELELIKANKKYKIYKFEEIKNEFFTLEHREHLIFRTITLLELSTDEKTVKKNKNDIVAFLYKKYNDLINNMLPFIKKDCILIEKFENDKKEIIENTAELQETIILLNDNLEDLAKKLKNYNKTKYIKALKERNLERYKTLNELKAKCAEFEKWTIEENGYYSTLLQKISHDLNEETKNITIEFEKIDKNDQKYHTYSAIFNVIMHILLFTILLPIGLLLLGCGWSTKKK